MRWPINGCHISALRIGKKRFSMEGKFSVPRSVNWCHGSVPVGSDRLRGVCKKFIMKDNLRRRGQLIGCISQLHSVPETRFQWRKNFRSLGQSIGAISRCQSAPRCTKKIHNEANSPAPWPINRLHILVPQ